VRREGSKIIFKVRSQVPARSFKNAEIRHPFSERTNFYLVQVWLHNIVQDKKTAHGTIGGKTEKSNYAGNVLLLGGKKWTSGTMN
jgi:hypothetical protein